MRCIDDCGKRKYLDNVLQAYYTIRRLLDNVLHEYLHYPQQLRKGWYGFRETLLSPIFTHSFSQK